MPISLSITLFIILIMVLEAIIAKKNETSDVYDFKVEQK